MIERGAEARRSGSLAVSIGLVGSWLVYAGLASGLRTGPLAEAAALAPVGVFGALALWRFAATPPGPPVIRRGEPSSPSAVRRAVVVWAVLLSAGLLWEAWAFFQQSSWDVGNPHYPTLTVLLAPWLEHRWVRFAGWLVWLYAGWRLARR